MADARICVVGGGAAGTAAALRAAELGAEVILVERDDLGGAWLNRGALQMAVMFGLAAAKGATTWGAARDHAMALARERRGELVDRLHAHGVTVVAGDARVDAPGRVVVDTGEDELVIHAPTLILAPGAEPVRHPGLDYRHPTIGDLTQVFGWPSIPDRVLLAGGGPAAVGLATLLDAYGARVVLAVPGETLLPDEEPSAVAALVAGLAASGVEVLTECAITQVDQDHDLRVHLADGEMRRVDGIVTTELAPPAAGSDLDPDGIGVTRDARGFPVSDADLRVGTGDVYVVGDASRGMPGTHRAVAEGEHAAEHALGGAHRRERSATPRVVFGSIPLASVGLTTRAATAMGREVECRVGSGGEDLTGRPAHVSIVVEPRSARVLGVTAVGAGASELVAGLALPISWDCTTHELGAVAAPHTGLAAALEHALHGSVAVEVS
ncbi:MAG: NAD(P)/FAD-dependent oxidoreductase [Actinobacteria bacterium]|nr:NAD(P)/FAD-dependent oxidoreductase [Thermoleophilia bacterium]MCB9012216.1 NAD(P)/FAD-dependent oxidoreductase [Actinomycetota bacterium]